MILKQTFDDKAQEYSDKCREMIMSLRAGGQAEESKINKERIAKKIDNYEAEVRTYDE